MKQYLYFAVATIPLAVVAGYFLSDASQADPAISVVTAKNASAFHDLRINEVESFPALINPNDPAVVKLAKSFASPEAAYRFVRDDIKFAPFVPPGPVAATLQHGVGSCLGKAVLLYSIYRAMGMAASDVRIVMGLVVTPDGLADHVWIDLEMNGQCLQQDPSGLLGVFAFAEFPGNRYADTYAMKETFCFNETDFAVVSQLNRMR